MNRYLSLSLTLSLAALTATGGQQPFPTTDLAALKQVTLGGTSCPPTK